MVDGEHSHLKTLRTHTGTSENVSFDANVCRSLPKADGRSVWWSNRNVRRDIAGSSAGQADVEECGDFVRFIVDSRRNLAYLVTIPIDGSE